MLQGASFILLSFLSTNWEAKGSPTFHHCDIEEYSRKRCGYHGISADLCEGAGCCFRPSNIPSVPFCYLRAATRNRPENFDIMNNDLVYNFESGLYKLLNETSKRENEIPKRKNWTRNNSGETFSVAKSSTRLNIASNSLQQEEKACLKTFELFIMTSLGNYQCSISPQERIECSLGQLYRRNGESECTACTKRGCCYDRTDPTRMSTFCYQPKPRYHRPTASTALLSTSTTKQTWADILSVLGTGQKVNGQKNSMSSQNSWQQSHNSILKARPTQNTRKFIDQQAKSHQNSGKSQILGVSPTSNLKDALGNVLDSPSTKSAARNNLQNLLKSLQNPSFGSTSGSLNVFAYSNGAALPSLGLSNNVFSSLPSSSNIATPYNIFGKPQTNGQLNKLWNVNQPNTVSGNHNFGNAMVKPGLRPFPASNNIGNFLKSLAGGLYGQGNSKSSNINNFPISNTQPVHHNLNVAPGVGFHLPGIPPLGHLVNGNPGFLPHSGSSSAAYGESNNVNSIYNMLFSGSPRPINPKNPSDEVPEATSPMKAENSILSKVEGRKEKGSIETSKTMLRKVSSGGYEKTDEKLPGKTCYPENCGTTESSITASRRIVGGQWAGGIHYWPWMASFRRNFTDDSNFNHVCGAALISKQWILTAGHCFVLYRSKSEKVSGSVETKINSFVIWFGTYARKGAELTSQIGVLEIFIPHPKYDFEGLEYDIAVAKLKEEVILTDYVRPVCLPSTNLDLRVGEQTWITGWGETLRVGGHDESKLKELPLPLTSFEECKMQWTSYQSKDWICTEGAYLEDACTGDSGGPLVHQRKTESWEIVGVAIAGTKRCSTERSDLRPGIYTSVAYYREFIDVATNGTC